LFGLIPDQGVHWPARSGWHESIALRLILSRFGIIRLFHGAKPWKNGVNRQEFHLGVGRYLDCD
jgi:hypothetical protein